MDDGGFNRRETAADSDSLSCDFCGGDIVRAAVETEHGDFCGQGCADACGRVVAEIEMAADLGGKPSDRCRR